MRDVLATHTDPKEVALVVVSKSGNTAETITNANTLFKLLCKQFGSEAASTQTIVVSDEHAPLATAVKEQGIQHLTLPAHIGGRYSVFTAVGLVPLALVGADIRAFAAGAAAAGNAAVPEHGASSAGVIASLLYEAYRHDIRLHELFMWHPELETLGKWYRQLLAESIGKERHDGTKVGVMPTVALGSIDLHSLGQLVFGGPKDRFTTFVAAPTYWENTPVLADSSPFTIPMLAGKSAGNVMQAIYEGVRTTYKTHELPYMSFEFGAINEREIGAFMATHMASVMCLAQLLEVNAFNQPDVEDYKDETRRLLGA
jgi:glucose-6-phosphate isomerase